MKILIVTILGLLFSSSLSIDFNKQTQDWETIVDGVMGGKSEGKVTLKKETLLFTGNISFQNNGGFSSLRNKYGKYDLSGYQEVEIRYRNLGQAFNMTLETSEYWFQPYFKKLLGGEENDWSTLNIPLDEFQKTQVGRKHSDKATKEDLSKVIRFGFINAGKKEGPFELEIDYIRFQ